MARRQSHDVIAPVAEEGVCGVEERTDFSLDKCCECRIKVGFGTDCGNMQKPPATAGSDCNSLTLGSVFGLFGFTSKPIAVTLGTSSRSTSRRFANSSLPSVVT